MESKKSSTTERSKLIKFSVGLIAEASNKKVTEALLMAWTIGLDKVHSKYIQTGVKILIQEKTDSFMPAPGELREICRDLRNSETKLKKVENGNNEKIDYQNIPLLSEKAGSLAKELGKKIKKNKITRPKITLYEFLDPKTAELEKIESKGHPELNFFEDQCYVRYKKRPHTSKHEYRVFKQIVKKDNNDKVISTFKTYIECDERTRNAEPITTGYFI